MISTVQKDASCTVISVFFPREEFREGVPTWCKFSTNIGVCCGKMPFYPKKGMVLKLHGAWGEWHGQKQFAFTKIQHDTPQDSLALLKYVATLTKGVGDSAVNKIYSQFGDAWREHLDEIAPNQAMSIRRTLDALATDKDRMDVIKFILMHGGTPRIADLAFAKWRSGTIGVVSADPYILTELEGVGFRTVDQLMREKFGIAEDSLRRAVCAVNFCVETLFAENGDSVLDRDALIKSVQGMGISRDNVTKAMAELTKSGRLVYVDLASVTTADVVKHEADLASYFIQNTRTGVSSVDDGEIYADEFELDDTQRAAVRNAVCGVGLTVINGGAGCGKTCLVKTISRILESRGERVRLCAFAGKAAARIREATGHDASTIHSLLGYSGEGTFRGESLEGCTVILDEASMVPSSLLYEISRRNPKRLILVGDQAQLQPVGIGSPFHDAIDLLPGVVHTLTTCYRNKEAVFAAASSVRAGETPKNARSSSETFAVINVPGPSACQGEVISRVDMGLIDFAQDLVLAPRNGEGEDPMPSTVKSLNAAIQAIVNPHRDGGKFKLNDRVMCTKNAPRLNVWNGTTGWITRIDIDNIPWFRSDDTGEEVRLSEKDVRDSFVPAYCLTVHKSQGSQYRDVYIACLQRDSRMFDRSMLYTAITRARRGCYVFTDCGLAPFVDSVKRRKTYLTKLIK